MPTIEDLRLGRGERIRYLWFNDLCDVLYNMDVTAVIDPYGYVRRDLIPDPDLAIRLGIPSRRWKEVHSGYERVSFNIGVGTNDPTAAVDINSDLMRLRTNKTIVNANDSGNKGDFCWDADYIYVCIDADTWKRSPISTWP